MARRHQVLLDVAIDFVAYARKEAHSHSTSRLSVRSLGMCQKGQPALHLYASNGWCCTVVEGLWFPRTSPRLHLTFTSTSAQRFPGPDRKALTVPGPPPGDWPRQSAILGERIDFAMHRATGRDAFLVQRSNPLLLQRRRIVRRYRCRRHRASRRTCSALRLRRQSLLPKWAVVGDASSPFATRVRDTADRAGRLIDAGLSRMKMG